MLCSTSYRHSTYMIFPPFPTCICLLRNEKIRDLQRLQIALR